MFATECQQVRSDLFFWQAYERAVKCDLSSSAHRIGGEFVLIDPIPMSEEAIAELTGAAKPMAIVLTNGNHGRAATAWRERFSIPVLAHAAAADELEIPVDGVLSEESRFLDHFDVVELPGAAAGEIALYADGVIHVGDALIHLEATGLALLPAKYCTDARLLRASLGKLLRFEFEVLTFAHGLPLVSGARSRLEPLLA